MSSWSADPPSSQAAAPAAAAASSGPAGAATPVSGSPAWVLATRGARYVKEEQVNQAVAELGKLPADLAVAANTLLGQLADTEPTPEGLIARGKKLEQALPSFVSKTPISPGQDPNQRRLLRCALLLFHGRVQRVAKNIAADHPAQAPALLRAVAALRVALRGASIGIALEEEARAGLGHDLFDKARETIASTPG